MAKRAKKVFSTKENMKQPGFDLCTVSFNAMLDACAKCSAYIALIACGRDKAVNVELDILTSTLVKGNCSEIHADRALRVVNELKIHESFTSDEVIYSSRDVAASHPFHCCCEQQRR